VMDTIWFFVDFDFYSQLLSCHLLCSHWSQGDAENAGLYNAGLENVRLENAGP